MNVQLLVGIILGAALIIGVASVVVKRRRAAARRLAEKTRRERAAQTQNVDPLAQDLSVGGDPRALKAGDMVDYLGDGERYVVRGELTFQDGSYTWKELFIDSGAGAKRYLSVEEEDGDLKIILWVGERGVALEPGPKHITYLGVTYKLKERGEAAYEGVGTTGLPPKGRVEYFDYEAKGDKFLSFERFDARVWEISRGEGLPETFLTIYPGPSS